MEWWRDPCIDKTQMGMRNTGLGDIGTQTHADIRPIYGCMFNKYIFWTCLTFFFLTDNSERHNRVKILTLLKSVSQAARFDMRQGFHLKI